MNNLQIARLFNEVAASYIIKDEKKYRFQIIAYQNASEIVKNLKTELKDLYKKNELIKIPGIGPTIKAHLEELYKTGTVKHFSWVKKDIPDSVFVLINIPSFGPKKAFKLVHELKLNKASSVISDLKKMAKNNKIASISGFGNKSQADIIRAIKEYRENKGKLSRLSLINALEIAEKILNYLTKNENVIRAEVLGSLRRKKETVGDIDIAVSSNNKKGVINYFIKYPKVERVIEKGNNTSSVLISGGVQIDLMIQSPNKFGSLLQHFTGSKNHNIKLREIALKKGLSLSEHGIKKETKITNYTNEKDFYNALDMDWIPPELREDKGEIELALSHKVPKLVELRDIKGDLHIHSDYPIEPSHDMGENSIEEIINKAKQLNYEYIGFSDHNPSVSKHTEKQMLDILKKRNEKIEQKTRSIKNVRVFKMLEVDILPNGNLSLSNNSLELLDAVIVSIHSSFKLDKKTMTNRIINALGNPKAKILGHPTGRLLDERPSYELDWDKIFDYCFKNNKAIEMNSSPKRPDPPDYIIKEGAKKGIKFVINTDSHTVLNMDFMKYGVFMARRGWLTKNDILNTLSYNNFYKWLKGGDIK